MSKTKKMCYLAVLTALYVVMSAFLRFSLGAGNIQLDLGYVAFSVAICKFGIAGAFVGVAGCAIESALFSAYGFSIGWAVANLIIGIGCGAVFSRTRRRWARIAAIIVFSTVGLLVAKTAIECWLYSIPLVVKLPKSITAFAADSAVMIAGLLLYDILERRERG